MGRKPKTSNPIADFILDDVVPEELHIKVRPEESMFLHKELTILDRALVETLREGSDNFWFFLTQVLFPETWKEHYHPDFHRPLCDMLTSLRTGEELAIFLPRQSRKSYIFTVAHCIWRIVQDPDVRILLVGAREDTVKPFARTILQSFLPDTPGFETFRQTFPEFVITHRQYKHILQSLQFTHPRRRLVLPDPTFRATYAGVTGAGWRCDILILDDVIERRNVTTPEQSKKALRNILDLSPLVDMKSKYRNTIYLGTRWAYHDPYGKIIGERTEDDDEEIDELLSDFLRRNLKVVVRHAFEDPDRPCEYCPDHVMQQWPHGHPDVQNGEPILYPIITRDMLMAELARYRRDENLGEALWWHQYMNVCKSPGSQAFEKDWFVTAQWADWPSTRKRVLAIDSAAKDFQKAGTGDYMVALFGSFADDGRLLLRHGLRSNRWTKDEFIRRIITACVALDWWPNLVVKEKVGEDAFLADLGRAFREKFRTPALLPVPRTRGLAKEDFIVQSLQAPAERGEIIFGSGLSKDIAERLIYELTNLGQVTHDDVADTLALFFQPNVRVMKPNRGIEVAEGITPPSLDTYRPSFSPQPAGPRISFEPPDPARDRMKAILDASWGSSFASPRILFRPDSPGPVPTIADPDAGTGRRSGR